MSEVPKALTIDSRPLFPSHRHALILAVLDTLADMGGQQSLVIAESRRARKDED